MVRVITQHDIQNIHRGTDKTVTRSFCQKKTLCNFMTVIPYVTIACPKNLNAQSVGANVTKALFCRVMEIGTGVDDICYFSILPGGVLSDMKT